MSDINKLIMEKLKKYDPLVEKLSSEALSLSLNLPEKAVTERLENIVKKLVKDSGSGGTKG